MTLPSFADVDDVIAEFGNNQIDAGQVDRLLGKASTLIRNTTGSLWVDTDGNLDGDELGLDTCKQVCTSAVVRYLQNPAGVTQETTGPFSATFSASAQPSMYLTKAEKEQLVNFSTRGGLSTVSTSRGVVETPSGRCTVTTSLDADALLT